MNRKNSCIALLLMCVFIFSSCKAVTITPEVSAPIQSPVAETAPVPKADRYTVIFEENETFSDKISQRAAQHIDPYIKQAVKLMNTVREDTYTFDALKCDYAARKKARDTITDPLSLEMYDIMVQKAFAFEDCCFDNSFAAGDLFNAAVTANDAVRLDYPYLLLYSDMIIKENTYTLGYYLPGDWIDSLCHDREKVKNEVALFDCTVERITEKMPENLTEWEKCMYFAFVIAAAVEYDNEMETMDNSYQAYDALVKGKALCGGYALAFYYLCQQEDIACWYCIGEAPYELGYHAWNIVETTDGPIYIDVTWYDEEEITDSYRQGKTNYLFMTQEDYDYYGYAEKSRR